VALPAIAAERRSTVPCCCGARRAAIDRYLLPAEPTAANPLHAAAAGEWDRQTDGHGTVTLTLLRYAMRAVPISRIGYAASAKRKQANIRSIYAIN